MSRLSARDFVRKATRDEPITPPALVSHFDPGDFPGSYKAFDIGFYDVNDARYGPVGTVHLRPRGYNVNPWTLPVGSGVILLNYIMTNDYSIDIEITKAARGTCVIQGSFTAQKTVRNEYSGNLEFGSPYTLDLTLSFLVGGGVEPDLPDPDDPDLDGISAMIYLQWDAVQRPKSGKIKIGKVFVSGGYNRSINWEGSSLPTEKISDGWDLYVNSGTPLGLYRITGVSTTIDGQRYTIGVTATIDVVKGESIPSPGPIMPTPPTPPPGPPMPVPVIVPVWGAKKRTVETTVLGDADAQAQWVSTTSTEATGESKTEAEILPKKTIPDFLPLPTVLRPIISRQIKRGVDMFDSVAIGQSSKIVKKIRFAGVDSWGALQQYAEQKLIDAARCVEGKFTLPCNPFIRAGDIIRHDGQEWIVERATHSLANWTTLITGRRTIDFSDLSAVFAGGSDSPEKSIIRVIKNATGRVDNAVEGVITKRIDARTYLVRVTGKNEEIEVSSDHVVFGDLLVGSVVLIGKGTI